MTTYCHDLDSVHIFGPGGVCIRCPQRAEKPKVHPEALRRQRARERAAQRAPEAPEPLQCRWYGGTTHPEENGKCKRPAKHREWNMILCDRHYLQAHTDPEDWEDEDD
jgi:hypothetical protein